MRVDDSLLQQLAILAPNRAFGQTRMELLRVVSGIWQKSKCTISFGIWPESTISNPENLTPRQQGVLGNQLTVLQRTPKLCVNA